MDLISIIVPVYNVEEYLDRCIESIVNQTFQNIEIIIVDDGSTDNSGQLCDIWQERDPRIAVYHKKNGGLSDARNYGIEHANGSYFMFVDSDDSISHYMVEILYNVICKHGADIAFCNYCTDEKDLYQLESVGFSELEMTKIQAMSDLYTDKHIPIVVVWNKLYKKELFENVKFDVGRIHEDEFIMHKLFDLSDKLVYVDCMLYFYFQRENSIMGKEKSIRNLDYLLALGERLVFFKEKQYWELYAKTIETYLDMNIYYTTFVPGLTTEKKQELINDYKVQYIALKDKQGIPIYKRVLWFCYKSFPVLIQLLLRLVKKLVYSKREFQYK